MTSKSYGWDVRNIAKISLKMAKKPPFFDFFRFSQKLSIRFERNFLQLFYTILESYMCNGIKIVWLGCEKHSQNYSKNGQKKAIFRLQKEKDLSRLFYRTCGSGLTNVTTAQKLNSRLSINFIWYCVKMLLKQKVLIIFIFRSKC